MKKQLTAFLLMVILSTISTYPVKAQDKQDKNAAAAADSGTNKLSKRLSIDKEKAGKIQAAYNFHRDDITLVMKNNTLNPAQKQAQLKRLLAQRRQQIDSLVTPAQKALLKQDQADILAKEDNRRRQVEQRHEQEINRVPHKRTMRRQVVPDSTKTKVKPIQQ
jgi:hypothetical protein